MIRSKIYKIYIFLPLAILLFSFVPSDTKEVTGVFKCSINDKPFELTGQKAYLREITGGRSQLAFYNKLFTKFTFFNPSVKHLDLATVGTKEVIVRYTEPGTNLIYYPKAGFINISSYDKKKMTISGDFEIELQPKHGRMKTIRVSKGQFINIPIVVIK